jgi:hypothetical protein
LSAADAPWNDAAANSVAANINFLIAFPQTRSTTAITQDTQLLTNFKSNSITDQASVRQDPNKGTPFSWLETTLLPNLRLTIMVPF